MRARWHLALLVLTGLLLVGGCGTPPWVEARPTPTVTASPTRSPTATPTAAVRNDLANGSLKRKLTAGGVQLTATYFSTLTMADWTPAASKPVTVSVVGSFADESPQNIYLSKLTVIVDVAGTDGPLPPPAPMIDEASVVPGYLITAPTSYGQVFTLAGLDPAATAVTLNLSYELLIQVAPKSKRYAKQGTSDSLVVALVR